jgi:hypothetical protein
MRTILLLALLGASGCLPHSDYRCTTNAECGSTGTCEPVGFCSFPDTSCSGGSRFGTGAGSYENECVGAAVTDGGVDAPPVTIDAPPSVGCPSGYLPLTGAGAHEYKLITGIDDWATQMGACAATSASAYLVIPDDDAEILALSGLAGATQYWVGISDPTEGMYVTVKGVAASYLPWTAGAPDNSGPGEEDCVGALSATSKLDDLKCSTKLRAICECEP